MATPPPVETHALLLQCQPALITATITDSLLGILGWAVAFMIGFVASLLIEPLKRWYLRPRIRIVFQNNDAFVARTPESLVARVLHPGGNVVEVNEPTHNAVYVRVRVSNELTWRGSSASGCCAYLVKVEREAAKGGFEDAKFFDPVQLAWASRKDANHPGREFETRDLPKGMFFYIDVISTRETEPAAVQLVSQAIPFRQTIGKADGRYRFTIVVAGDNFDPVYFPFTFRLTGKWDDIRFD